MPSIKPLKAGFQIAIITFQKRKTQDHFLLSFPFTKVSFHPQRRPPCCQPWIASVNRYTHTQKDGDQQNPTNKLASCCEFPQSWEHVTGVMSRRQQHTRRHLSIEQKNTKSVLLPGRLLKMKLVTKSNNKHNSCLSRKNQSIDVSSCNSKHINMNVFFCFGESTGNVCSSRLR